MPARTATLDFVSNILRQGRSWIDLNKGIGAGCGKIGLLKLRRGVHPPYDIGSTHRRPSTNNQRRLSSQTWAGYWPHIVMPFCIAYYGVGIGKEHGLGWGRRMRLACKKMSPDP